MSNKKDRLNIDSIMLALREAYGQKPDMVEGQLAQRVEYYKFVLLNKLKGEFENKVPKNWDNDYLLDHTLLDGKICVTKTVMGTIALKCGTHGVNVYDRNDKVTIANHVLGSFERKIGVDCVVISLYNNLNYKGVSECIDIYANRLANCDIAIDVNLLNTKIAKVFEVSDKQEADEMKMLYDKVQKGEPAVFLRRSNGAIGLSDKMTTFDSNVKQTYIAADIQALKRDIYNEFLTQFGINNAAQEKKERLLVDEVNSNNDELAINMNYLYGNLKRGVKESIEMFPELKGKFEIKLPYIDKLKELEKLRKENMNDTNRPNDGVSNKEQQREHSGDADK